MDVDRTNAHTMLYPTILWRLESDAGDVAMCRFMATGRRVELRYIIDDVSSSETFDCIADALMRAAQRERQLQQRGWRECLVVDGHSRDTRSGATLQRKDVAHKLFRKGPRRTA